MIIHKSLIAEIVTYIFSISFFALIGFMYFQQPNGIVPERYIENKNVRPGDILLIHIKPLKHRFECPAEINKSIVDASGAETKFVDNPKRDGDSFVISIIIPPAAVPGPAEYRVKILWKCNPLQQIWPRVENLPPLDFNIIDPLPLLGPNRSFLIIPQYKAKEATEMLK